jgi:hypothetical protein
MSLNPNPLDLIECHLVARCDHSALSCAGFVSGHFLRVFRRTASLDEICRNLIAPESVAANLLADLPAETNRSMLNPDDRMEVCRSRVSLEMFVTKSSESGSTRARRGSATIKDTTISVISTATGREASAMVSLAAWIRLALGHGLV